MPNMLTFESYKAIVPSACDATVNEVQPYIDAANAAAERYCNRTFVLAQNFTKYYDLPPPGGRNEVVMKERVVNSIASINIDGRGGYGQLTNTFGSTTLLVAGTDYYFEPGSDIVRILQRWSSWPAFGTFFYGGGGYGYPFGCNMRNANTGCVKIVFNAGWATWPADLLAGIAGIAAWMIGGGIESGGRVVTQYIDVGISSATAVDALGIGNVPALGTARQILNGYKEVAVPSAGRW